MAAGEGRERVLAGGVSSGVVSDVEPEARKRGRGERMCVLHRATFEISI